jgi:hypothetical protein
MDKDLVTVTLPHLRAYAEQIASLERSGPHVA